MVKYREILRLHAMGVSMRAYFVFLGVAFRGSPVRRSTVRRCALARKFGADGPRGHVRTCDGAILAHL